MSERSISGDNARDAVVIRRAVDDDADTIAEISIASFQATYAFSGAHTDDEVRRWIRDVVIAKAETWVAVDPNGSIAGYMTLDEDQLDQLYLRPGRTGQGIGSRLVRLAMARRPAGLSLYTFQVNHGARRFYERHGFVAVALGDGHGNEEGQPDVRYEWRPDGGPNGTTSRPNGTTIAPDGTPIAWYRTGSGSPIVLVHGAAADHTAWRTTGPLLATSHAVHAIDRRGRGASGDVAPYAIAREYEDLATVVDAVAAATGEAVDVVGHSYGGRVALGAALLTPNLRRLVSYEGAPAPGGRSFHGDPVMARLEAYQAAGDREGLLVCFMTEVVGMTPAELATFRASPTWPSRVAIAPTVVREMWAEAGEEAGPERYGQIRIPVLQVLGGASTPLFTDGTWALDRILPDSRVVVIAGAKHAAHHTHAERFADEVRRFLDADQPA